MDSIELLGTLIEKARIPIGLIGYGHWGHTIAQSLKNHNSCRLAAIVTSRSISTNQIPTGCSIYANAFEMYQSGSVAAIVIANSPENHFEVAINALKNNLPTWIEKPLTTDIRQSLELLQTAQRLKSRVFVNHIFVHSVAWSQFKKSAEFLGKLLNIQTSGGSPLPIRKDTPPLWDWGPHDISLILDLVGSKPNLVDATIVKNITPIQGNLLNTKIQMEFENGVKSSSIFGSDFKEKTRWVKAQFEYGRLELLNFEHGPIVKIIKSKTHDLESLQFPIRFLPRPLDNAIMQFIGLVKDPNTNVRDLLLGHDVVSVLSEAENQMRA